MSRQERARNALRKSRPEASDRAQNASPETPPAVAAEPAALARAADTPVLAFEPASKAGFERQQDGPRFWALPDPQLGWWILRENDTSVAGLTTGKAVIFTPSIGSAEKQAAAECCRALISARLKDVFHTDLFDLIKRMMLGGMLIVFGFFGLRLAGELKFLDLLLLLAALGYTAYAGLRYGMRVVQSMEVANRPFSQFIGEPFAENALAERLLKTLKYRREEPHDKRGDSPDEELLDTNAFRALIRDRVTTRRELAALGAAIDARLGLRGADAKSISEIVKAEGLDPESAALYRDLARAARELELEPEF